jgi:hypothetical protein
MKTRKGLIAAFLPLIITLSLFLVFYSRISCKPENAGFWLVLALGMAIGVVITRLSLLSRSDKTDKN